VNFKSIRVKNCSNLTLLQHHQSLTGVLQICNLAYNVRQKAQKMGGLNWSDHPLFVPDLHTPDSCDSTKSVCKEINADYANYHCTVT
jgi:hypothetical protein